MSHNWDEVITILNLDTIPRSRLYYYQGNFYHPLDLHGRFIGQVRGAIHKFRKENKSLIEQDRKRPDYKTLVQIFDEQFNKENS